MDYEFHSIIEKLAILEGRIAPKEKSVTEPKQKKPALFTNLKKKEESAIPMVGGVEFAEEKSNDVLSQVKASLVDYLKSAEDSIKQDKDLIAKKKQDLDLKKKELKDLELQYKAQEIEETDPANSLAENHQQLEVGDRICVIGHNDHQGEFGNITEFSPSGKFVVVDLGYGKEISMHLSDVEFHDDQEDVEDWEDEKVDEDPNQTPAQGEGVANQVDPTYAQGSNNVYETSAPVKTVNVELDEMGGSVLVEIHGDERNGFSIKRAGKEMSTKFKSLEEAEIALEMFNAHRKAQAEAEQSADYIDEA